MLMEVITEQMEVILWLQIINPQTNPPERKNERERMQLTKRSSVSILALRPHYRTCSPFGIHLPLTGSSSGDVVKSVAVSSQLPDAVFLSTGHSSTSFIQALS